MKWGRARLLMWATLFVVVWLAGYLLLTYS
jgi:hypothetical protein